MPRPTEASFLEDVKNHRMKVRLDQGVYRHLRFQQPNNSWNMCFDIVTWPGYLAYTGDMGSFVFTRLEDMFEFFRTRPSNCGEKLYINQSYWAEKLEAVDRCGRGSGAEQYCEERFKSRVNEAVAEWVEEFEGEYDSSEEEIAQQREAFETELREAIEEDVLRYGDDGEYEAHRALRDFSCEIDGHKYEFSDTWEWDLREYTYRFTWCCYALAWAIKQYDEVLQTVG